MDTFQLMTRPVTIRESLRNFVIEMEKVLRDNDYKGGWKAESLEYLIKRAMTELGELSDALLRYQHNDHQDNAAMVVREAVDVANYMMMIADKVHHKT